MVDHPRGLMEDLVGGRVDGAEREAFAGEDAPDFVFGDRPKSGEFRGRVAERADFAGGRREVRGCLAMIAQGVELHGELGKFHGE